MQSGCGQIAGVGRGQRGEKVMSVIVGQGTGMMFEREDAREKGMRRMLWVVSATER